MLDLPLYIYPLILLVALLYSSVGHGGASGYLALMAIVGVNMASAKPVALSLNCIVSLISFIQYYRSGHFNAKLFFILAIASVPFAYLGGLLTLEEVWYKRVLGVVLLFASIRIFFPLKENNTNKKTPIVWLLISGACIGFLSGLIGIGGGIILTPLLLLMGWSNLKTAACVSALFIFVNSGSGLIAQFQKGFTLEKHMLFIISIATVGGLIGAYYGAKKWDIHLLKKVLSFVLIIASIKLIFV